MRNQLSNTSDPLQVEIAKLELTLKRCTALNKRTEYIYSKFENIMLEVENDRIIADEKKIQDRVKLLGQTFRIKKQEAEQLQIEINREQGISKEDEA